MDTWRRGGTHLSITTKIRNGKNEYTNATRSVWEWCALVIPLLNGYLRLVRGPQETVEAQKKILAKVFADGVEKMGRAVTQLDSCAALLNEASGELVALHTTLKNDFGEKSTYFRSAVSRVRMAYVAGITGSVAAGPVGFGIAVTAAAITEAVVVRDLKKHFSAIQVGFQEMTKSADLMTTEITTATRQLDEDKDMISDLSAKTESSRFWCDLEDVIMEELATAAKDLIELCQAYQERHGKKH
ncbi:hemolysin E [Achlya hypogyna]|uniref:Hemolysin E n=1 Tax=Achlya hypogyna TaxID=1202772 RepID=A0A1V9ZT26_ACHHY|nr:hemolysin E [Achlya hypogyna]